jgi:hypothetical protein
MNTSEVSKRFEHQRPSPDGVNRIERVRAACKELARILEAEVPTCRELSLAITKLEEVSMWANRAIVFHLQAPVDNQ